MEIKLVIWDLDNTIWDGTLAEKEDVILKESRLKLIKELNKKGIVNSICSKNNFQKTKDFMVSQNIWEDFVFPKIEFAPKGELIKTILNEMHLRAENTLFIDDNDSNLQEALFYNPNINILNERESEEFFSKILCTQKDDNNFKRFKQYKLLEEKTNAVKKYSSNEEFLKQSNIRISFLDFEENLFDRLYELSERTNQLNFTKNRMTKDELHELVINKSIQTKLIHAYDNYGDYGIIGFYSLFDNKLIHFVFSCRIMNMGIEQFVYQYLNYPNIDIIGDVASTLDQNSKIDYIKIESQKKENNYEGESIEAFLEEDSKVKIFGLGACDLYHPIAYFSMPNQDFLYECNVFIGNERGVNVGTEYIRSQLEMNKEEKEFCKHHFYNYTRYNVFKSNIFNEDWDYIIMSFHDDMIYKIYKNKKDPNLRVILSPEPLFGLTSVININNKTKLPYEEQKRWLNKNFSEGQYITQERFLDNLLWIKEHTNKFTKIVLISGPEINYFRKNHPTCPETLEQIKKINKVIKDVGKDHSDRFLVVDINDVIKTKEDVTDYVFHLKAETAYKLFTNLIHTIIEKSKTNKPPMLNEKILKGRKLGILGSNIREVKNAYFNLKLGNLEPLIINNIFTSDCDQDICTINMNDILNDHNKYFIIIADNNNYPAHRQTLMEHGFSPISDFLQLKPIKYKKIWQD